MTKQLLRFKAPLVGLVAVLFSASIALAAQPASPGANGRATASQHAGQTVPVGSPGEQSGTPDESDDSGDSGDTSGPTDSGNACNIDLTDSTAVAAAANHGAVVCSAAHMTTVPDGYANKGAWVSHWAKMNHGADASATGKSHKPSSAPSH